MAEEEYTTLEMVNISKLKVPDLKRELKARGLNTTGNKMELVQRLSDVMHSGKNDDGSHGSAESVDDEDDVLNDDEIEEEVGDISNIDELEVKDSNKSFETITTTVKPLKRKNFEIANNNSTKDEKTAKKIVLNRNLSTEVLQSENNISPDIPTNGTAADKRVIKFSELSAKERLEMRAKKFGVPLSHDAKKEVRAQRFGQNTTVDSNKTTITLGNSGGSVEVLKKRAERFGASVSTQLKKVEIEEKREKRKERFGEVTNGATSVEDKKAKRLERFKITLK